MNKKFLIIMAAFFAIGANCLFAQNPSAQEILRMVEKNENYSTIEYEGEMIILHNGRQFVKTLKAWARGDTHSFIEFTNPGDRGTKYLRRDGRLWVYSPDNEGVMLISGHMLRESMMGSDMSYEDSLDNDPLSGRYDAVLAGSEQINNRDCWVLDLKAKKRTESYPSRKLWIDRENNDVLRYELFALSGTKLKDYNLLKIEEHNGRRFPVEIEIRDLLRKNSKTTFKMRNVVLDKPIADSVFSMRNLER